MNIKRIKGFTSDVLSKIKNEELSFLEKEKKEIDSLTRQRKIVVIKELLWKKGQYSARYLEVNKKIEAATEKYNKFAAKQQAAQASFEALNKK